MRDADAGKGKKWWRYCFERGADGSILDLAEEEKLLGETTWLAA